MPNKENLYEIRELNCSYDKKNTVLKVNKLDIPKGNIVFFVGSSGIGKSTILETLGLMNNTILQFNDLILKYNGEDIRDAWTWNDDILSEFRNKNFSFIFQQTNLMSNFSTYENIMITGLLQGEMPLDETRRKTKEIMIKMKLDADKDRPITAYSGGERQRIAFSRAIMPKFKVLFGDEPTGNLDPKSATNLMSILRYNLHEQKASAIIVSHDIDLAVKNADIIVHIQSVQNSSDEKYGLIDEKSIYSKVGETWLYQEENICNDELILRLKNLI